ncbi:MAG: Metal dependent phosphohydrolase, partial [Patescibacteria group bacterium]|nr:Metal dependent phosphohydrolase [Patescibacteria group bacterium]
MAVNHLVTGSNPVVGAGASEEVVIAGILHDTIEDSVSEKKVTREMLVERFGEEVA